MRTIIVGSTGELHPMSGEYTVSLTSSRGNITQTQIRYSPNLTTFLCRRHTPHYYDGMPISVFTPENAKKLIPELEALDEEIMAQIKIQDATRIQVHPIHIIGSYDNLWIKLGMCKFELLPNCRRNYVISPTNDSLVSKLARSDETPLLP